MKTVYALLSVLLFIGCRCHHNQYSTLPTKVDIYYEFATCPWLLLKFVDTSPEDFLNSVNISHVELTDSSSLKYFHDLKMGAKYSKSSSDNFDTWFCAILDYGTYNDTVSVNSRKLKYGEKVIIDTNAVLYYMDSISNSDSVTRSSFQEYFYDGDFQIIRKNNNMSH